MLRNEDLDPARCRPEFVTAMMEDLRWFGFEWLEGPDCGGPFAPYIQSERHLLYRVALERLFQEGLVYPCTCSRRDVQRALRAPHQGEDEPVYPGTCRPKAVGTNPWSTDHEKHATASFRASAVVHHVPTNWRFRVPDGAIISFTDGHDGPQQFVAGSDFGDFVVWRHDEIPAYQLAVVVDDAAMQITEVVRGADLLKSTARQILLYRAMGWQPPTFYHCPLITDESGLRLAKRHDALSLRHLRARGVTPESLRESWLPTL